MKCIALIGCGGWGKNHARTLNELGVLYTICDQNTELLSELSSQYKNVRTTNQLEVVLADPDVRGVVVATPSNTHYSVAMRALEMGKDVLVEKPMALLVSEATKMHECAVRNGRILMVGHVLEFHPAILKIRQLISSGELGKIYSIQSNRLNLGKIRTEENALWSFAPHDIAIILRLVGEDPIAVNCHGGAFVNSSVADLTISTLKFPSQILATISVSWLHPFKDHSLVVVGSKQMVVFNDLLSWEEKLKAYSHRVEWRGGKIPVAEKVAALGIPLEPVESLRAECEHFLACIKSRKTPLTDSVSGIRVLSVLEGLQRSLVSEGKTQSVNNNPTDYFVHPSAVVDSNAKISVGAKIWHFSHVMGSAVIGKNSIIGQNVFVANNVQIGDKVKIQNNVSVYEGVTIEDEVFCGPSMVFTNVMNPRSAIERKNEFRPTTVRRGATIGANATIVCGHTIGRHAFVGAGSVVTRDVPDYALVIGNPARIAGWVCECGVGKLEFTGTKAHCSNCNRRYRKFGNECLPEKDQAKGDENAELRIVA